MDKNNRKLKILYKCTNANTSAIYMAAAQQQRGLWLGTKTTHPMPYTSGVGIKVRASASSRFWEGFVSPTFQVNRWSLKQTVTFFKQTGKVWSKQLNLTGFSSINHCFIFTSVHTKVILDNKSVHTKVILDTHKKNPHSPIHLPHDITKVIISSLQDYGLELSILQ